MNLKNRLNAAILNSKLREITWQITRHNKKRGLFPKSTYINDVKNAHGGDRDDSL